MSLINKMLQDLDARGVHGGGQDAAPGALRGGAQEAMPVVMHGHLTPPAGVKAVRRDERAVPLPVVVGGIVGAVVLAVAGAAAWRWWRQPAAPVPVPVLETALQTDTRARTQPLIALAPQPPGTTMPAASVAPVAAVPLPLLAPAPSSRGKATVQPAARPAPMQAAKAADAGATSEAGKPGAMRAPLEPASAKAPPQAPAARAVPDGAAGKRQPAEDAYRRALLTLQEGRVAEAIAQLELALRQEPRHEAARQTLVGLLIENRRMDDAVRVLQTGLALDPGQSALAMLLARLQIDAGGSGVDTLQRSLPAAAGNPDYLAFLAGALQRDGRHREAAEAYVAALRQAPEQGVWLMGLGISLQADRRRAEALDAFQRARATGTLPAELQAFVERKIAQLSP